MWWWWWWWWRVRIQWTPLNMTQVRVLKGTQVWVSPHALPAKESCIKQPRIAAQGKPFAVSNPNCVPIQLQTFISCIYMRTLTLHAPISHQTCLIYCWQITNDWVVRNVVDDSPLSNEIGLAVDGHVEHWGYRACTACKCLQLWRNSGRDWNSKGLILCNFPLVALVGCT